MRKRRRLLLSDGVRWPSLGSENVSRIPGTPKRLTSWAKRCASFRCVYSVEFPKIFADGQVESIIPRHSLSHVNNAHNTITAHRYNIIGSTLFSLTIASGIIYASFGRHVYYGLVGFF